MTRRGAPYHNLSGEEAVSHMPLDQHGWVDVEALMAQLAEAQKAIAVHADVLAETIHKHEQQLAEVTKDKQDMIWERDDLLKQLSSKDRRLAVVEGAIEKFLNDTNAIPPWESAGAIWAQRIKELHAAWLISRAALAGADASEQLTKETTP